MAVESWVGEGIQAKVGLDGEEQESGELVCTRPFPCQPVSTL